MNVNMINSRGICLAKVLNFYECKQYLRNSSLITVPRLPDHKTPQPVSDFEKPLIEMLVAVSQLKNLIALWVGSIG